MAAIQPNKLKAFADQPSPSGMAAISNPSVDPTADLMGDDEDLDDEDDLDDEEDDAPAGDPKARGDELLASWGVLGAHLKEDSGEIIDAAHEVGGDLLLAKPPEEAIEEVEDGFDRMPEEIQHCLAKYVAKLPPDDVTALATTLCDSHDGDTEDADVKLVASYLTTLSAHAAEEVDPEDIEDEEEDEEDEDAPKDYDKPEGDDDKPEGEKPPAGDGEDPTA